MSKGKYQIPFCTRTGCPVSYDRGYDIQWRDNIPFEDVLTYFSYGRGRSSATLQFKTVEGITVEFFMSDFDLAVPHMKNGVLRGRFEFVKKGQNYGCKMLEAT